MGWWKEMIKEDPKKAQMLFRMMNVRLLTETDFREFIEMGFTFEEMKEFLPAGTDPEQVKLIYLKYKTDLGKILYDDRET